MQIIALTTEPSSSRGGQPLSTLSVCQSLAERGHSIILLYWKEGDLLEQYQKFCQKIIQVQVKDINKYQLIRSSIKLLYSTFLTANSLSLSKQEKKVIYLDDCQNCLFANLFGFFKGTIPSVFHIRQPILPKVPRKYWIGIKKITAFITVSQKIKEQWSNLGLNPSQFTVVLNGVDPLYYQPSLNWQESRKLWGLSQDEKIITYLGRLDREKGLETLLKSFSLLNQASQLPLRLLIAGRPVLHPTLEQGEQYKQFLQQLTIDLKIQEQVSFLGYVKNTVKLYQASDLIVLPSVYAEPCARVIIEAMACGIPIIASNSGGNPELLNYKFQDFLFEINNEKELFQKLETFIDWRKDRPKLQGELHQFFLNNLTLERNVNQVEDILQSVAK
ncbi:glycosyltransferase family 4 protein [Spirulina sp. CS-785/01]|uniref:glycosyltransferase family 4 protein n=1 Tax=Spirulina sp. CS-785/01 TaxID=3021716 RepID=UPI00232AE7EC|nr:glycosyltransferase family 4 protein [Spirulina sp. CS-785/01]MDB9314590.1 glycosyltransferase family 4 protein [Spirulina sp. CS-785/01]